MGNLYDLEALIGVGIHLMVLEGGHYIDFPDIQWPIEIPGLGGLTIPKLNLSGFNLGEFIRFRMGWNQSSIFQVDQGKFVSSVQIGGYTVQDGSGDWDFELDFQYHGHSM